MSKKSELSPSKTKWEKFRENAAQYAGHTFMASNVLVLAKGFLENSYDLMSGFAFIAASFVLSKWGNSNKGLGISQAIATGAFGFLLADAALTPEKNDLILSLAALTALTAVSSYKGFRGDVKPQDQREELDNKKPDILQKLKKYSREYPQMDSALPRAGLNIAFAASSSFAAMSNPHMLSLWIGTGMGLLWTAGNICLGLSKPQKKQSEQQVNQPT